MTSLRTFQTEIGEIHSREIAKQRAQAKLDRGKEKENVKENSSKVPQVKAKDPESDGLHVDLADVSEVEKEIQVTSTFHTCPGNLQPSRHYSCLQILQTTTACETPLLL